MLSAAVTTVMSSFIQVLGGLNGWLIGELCSSLESGE